MSWRALPPAGQPIASSGDGGPLPAFAGYRAVWVNSGTAALSLAFMLARQRYPDVPRPEVILPGYGCPDLVAAAVHAGVQPVLADIGDDDPGYNLNSLAAALSTRTIAVVAVNFLGIRERLVELRELLRKWPAVSLIEDDAQWFPEPATGFTLETDAVCLSFGRGKPVSLLGGGALFIREDSLLGEMIAAHALSAGKPEGGLPWKIRAYNVLRNPWCYGLLSLNPFLTLGDTVFKPLRAMTGMDPGRLALLPRNVGLHLLRSSTAAGRIHASLPAAMDLPGRLGARVGRLLRYPVLDGNLQRRNASWERLRGLGATAMYRLPLPNIAGVGGQVVVRGDLTGAARFADRLLTLPVHDGVSAADTQRMAAILERRA